MAERLHWKDAERITGKRLDRRRRYEVFGGEVGEVVSFVDACSGCTEVGDYESGPERGGGCHECGYTGRRRQTHFVPVDCGGGSRG